jgi:hypothetical protein
MTNAINAKSEALELHELSSEELDRVSGGFIVNLEGVCSKGGEVRGGPMGMLNQIMQISQQAYPG